MKILHYFIMAVLSFTILFPLNAVWTQSEPRPTVEFDGGNYFINQMIQCNDLPVFCQPYLQDTKDKVTITVTDPGANKFSASIDRITVYVWSDSDKKGIVITAYETQVNSGIFKGIVLITYGQSTQNRIHVSDGDTLSTKYIYAISSRENKSESHHVMATSFIGNTGPPLERVIAGSLKIVDNNGKDVSEIKVGKQIGITSNLLSQRHIQPFVYVVQIQNKDQATVSLSWLAGSLEPNQSLNTSQEWTPFSPGNFTVNIFVWESIDNPNALSPPLTKTVEVK